MALRNRILLLVLLAALLPAAAMIAFLFDQRDRQVADAKRNVSVLARNAGSTLDAKIHGTSQLLLGLSQSRELATDDRNACSAYLGRVLQLYPQYSGILTIRPDGKLHCDSLATGRELDLRDRGYFRRALVSRATELEAVFGRLTGLGVVQVAFASRDAKGAVQFVLLASLNLEQFARELSAAQPYPGTVVMVFDGGGTLMNRSGPAGGSTADAPAIGYDYSKTTLHAFVRSAAFGETRELPTGAQGPPRVWAVGEPTGSTGVKIALGVPGLAIGAFAERQMHAALAVILAATLLAVAAAWALSSLGIREPIERIMVATARFGAGDAAARIGAPYPRGEVGDLMRELDRILAMLQAEEAQILAMKAELEQRVAERTFQLQGLNDELKAFSYSVSHDLRAPLRAIDGYSAMALMEPAGALSPAARVLVERTRGAGRRMADLVDGLLALSNIASDERRHGLVNLSEMAREIAGRLQAEAPQRRAQFSIAPDVQGHGDATLLRQALENLLGNAWKYTSAREVAHIEFGAVELEGGAMEYFVADDGAGFDMAHADKLFRPFERLHAETEFPGTGIGLAIVRRIVHRHGGQVRAEGRLGEGVRFAFTLAPAPATPAPD